MRPASSGRSFPVLSSGRPDAIFINGKIVTVNAALRVDDAVAVQDSSAARYSVSEEKTGSIEPGKYADMVVPSDDILGVPEEAIKDIEAVRTIVENRTVFER